MLDDDDAIAVIGMATRVPGADDVEQFWDNLVLGVESVAPIDESDLRSAGVPGGALADENYVRVGATLDGYDCFDAGFFGYTPRDAAATDPQIRVLLELAHATLENAGYDPTAIDANVAVFASAGPSRYAELHLQQRPEDASGSGLAMHTLNHSDYVATTLAYRLDLHGPAATVLTACSSGLVAVHLACAALRAGDCDLALVGGSALEFPVGHGYRWTSGGILSRDGHCRPFDAEANGTVFGSGAVAVLLKPLAEARRDGDRVAAIILASAINNDGHDKVSFGAPSMRGQISVVMEATSLAGVRPGDIGYVEAHGTGTPLGDPMEVAALTEAYTALADDPLERGRTGLGSVKGNVGHLGPVAGLAGFVKAVLALEREQLPPSINVHTPNPRLNLPSTPFRIVDRLESWPRDPEQTRYAAVSSFGIGGTNAHVVLAEAPADDVRPDVTHRPRLLVWSGRDDRACDAAAARLADWLARTGDASFADTVATLQHRRTAHHTRRALVCTDARDARLGLTDPARVLTAAGERPPRLTLPAATTDDVAAFRPLLDSVPALRGHLDDVLAECVDGGSPPSLDDPWGPRVAAAARVALGRTWLGLGADPAWIDGPAPLVAAVTGNTSPCEVAEVPLGRLGDVAEPESVERAHLSAVAGVWLAGRPVDWAAAGCPPPVRCPPVPGYPFARQRHWVGAPAAVAPDPPTSWTPTWRDATASLLGASVSQPPPTTALLVLPAERSPVARATTVALAQAGIEAVPFVTGPDYGEQGRHYVGRPDDPRDVSRVLTAIEGDGRRIDLVVDARATAAGHGDALRLDALRDVLSATPLWLVITRNAADVSGREEVCPHAAALAFDTLRSLDSPAWLDVTDDVAPESIRDQLAEPGRVAALRGHRVWVPDRVPWTRAPGNHRAADRRGSWWLVVDTGSRLAASLTDAVTRSGLGVPLTLIHASGAEVEAALDRAVDVAGDVGSLVWTGDPAALRTSLDRALGERRGPPTGVVVGTDPIRAPTAALRAVGAALTGTRVEFVTVLRADTASNGDAAARALAWAATADVGTITADRATYVTIADGAAQASDLGSVVLDLIAARSPDHVGYG